MAVAVNGIPAFGCFWLSVAVTVCGGCLLLWLRVAVAATGYAYLWLSVVICGYLSLSVAGSKYLWLYADCIDYLLLSVAVCSCLWLWLPVAGWR